VELVKSQYARFSRLAQMGVLLAGEQHLPRLYDLIVREAVALTGAELGVIYMRQGDVVEPMAARSEVSWAVEAVRTLGSGRLALNRESLCGQVILEDKIFNLSDIRVFPEERPAALWPELSKLPSGCGRSLLALPLKTPQSGLMGVLLLMNARSFDGAVIPFDPQIEDLMVAVTAQAALAIQNVRWTMELHQAYQDTLYRLSLAAEYREDPSGGHIRRIGHYSALFGKACGFPEEKVEKLQVASAMHDIGKLSIPESILLKPARLTPEEFETMKKHTTLGAIILGGSKTEILQIAERIALSHHEKFDGTGYPYGQSGVEIPIEGRIVAVADVFDALTTARPYKAPIPFAEAVKTIQSESGKHFDPGCVQAFLKVKDDIKKILLG
jgi:putative two-component system response regulator